jgi:hypothetical protein
MDNEIEIEEGLPEVVPDLRVSSRGYAEGVDLVNCEFEGEVQPCVEFRAESGYTGSIVPLLDIVKHALQLYPQTVARACRELGFPVPEAIVPDAID